MDVINRIFSNVVPGEPVRLRPTLLLGEPGGGKSRLAERLAQQLALPVKRSDAGSTNDKFLVGSPRRWHSSYPSLPLSFIQECHFANPCIVIDELEKAGDSSAGSIHEPLLSLVDRKTSSAWHDHYVDASVDLSAVNWLFTANALTGIPAPLRNRLRVLTVPRPGKQHIPVIAARVLTERGVDPRLEPPLDGLEIDLITKAWDKSGGSVRHLQRLVERVIEVRHHSAERN